MSIDSPTEAGIPPSQIQIWHEILKQGSLHNSNSRISRFQEPFTVAKCSIRFTNRFKQSTNLYQTSGNLMARVTGSILSINYQCIFTVGLGLPEIFSSQVQISKAYIYRGLSHGFPCFLLNSLLTTSCIFMDIYFLLTLVSSGHLTTYTCLIGL